MNFRPLSFVTLSTLLLSLSPSALGAVTLEAWPTSTTGVDVTAALLQTVPAFEPSGLTWHAGRQQLLAVGDEGELATLNTDGSNVSVWYPGGDLEDVTLTDPNSSVVYLANENGSIYSYDLNTSKVLQSWPITEWMPEVNGNGMEGLTYANGYFYAGYQGNGKIHVLDLSKSTASLVKTMDALSSDYTDLSGLHYVNGKLYAIYDGGSKADVLAILDASTGTVEKTYQLPGSAQEGIAFGEDSNKDGDANLFIAQDSGQILSYDNFPLPAAPSVVVAPKKIELTRDKIDNDGDGFIDEANTLAENGLHPYYSTLDANSSSSKKIIGYVGTRNGRIYVRYADQSVYDYTIFAVRSKAATKVSLLPGTGYLNVTLGAQTVKINGYTGAVVSGL